MTFPLSVCMIVRDEELYLEGALESIYNVSSDIVIIDTGSNDSTMEIARRFGARIGMHKWSDDFSYPRNLAIELAKEQYILVMDADERLDHSSMKGLDDFFKSDNNKPGRVNIKNYTDNFNYSLSQSTRIFPNNEAYRYVGRIHEQIAYKGKVISGESTDISLIHYGYRQDHIKEKNKVERNLELLKQLEKENNSDPYILYQIGKTYFVDSRYEEALIYYKKVVDDLIFAPLSGKSYISSAWLSICYCFYYLGKFDLLINYIQSGIEFFSDYTDLYFIYGLALTAMNHPRALELIPEVFGYCLRLGEADSNKYETARGVGSFKAHYNLGIYWEIVGEKGKAIAHYTSSSKEGYEEASKRLNYLTK